MRYENSSQIMVRAIEFLKQKESENFYLDYWRDLKKAFGPGQKVDLNELVKQEFDTNFEGSSMELTDFRIYQEFHKPENLKLQKTVIEILDVRCTNKFGLDRFEKRAFSQEQVPENEII